MEQTIYLKKALSSCFKCFGCRWVVFLLFSGRPKGIFQYYRGRNLSSLYRLQTSALGCLPCAGPCCGWTKYLVLSPGLNGLAELRITEGGTWGKTGGLWDSSSTLELQQLFILHKF